MWLIYRTDMYNLDQYHRIFKPPATTAPPNVAFEIRAGGGQEGNGRQFLNFEDKQERDEIFDLISAALATGAAAFDIDAHLKAVEEGLAGEPHTPLLDAAWGVISNAHNGNWDEASEQWQGAANAFRNAYFNLGDDDA